MNRSSGDVVFILLAVIFSVGFFLFITGGNYTLDKHAFVASFAPHLVITYIGILMLIAFAIRQWSRFSISIPTIFVTVSFLAGFFYIFFVLGLGAITF